MVVGCNSLLEEQEGIENAAVGVVKTVKTVKTVKAVEEDYHMESSLKRKVVEAVGYMGKESRDQSLNPKLSLH